MVANRDIKDKPPNSGTAANAHTLITSPIMLSAGCSTARFATLPPYEPYVDVHGVQHKGTDAGEVFLSAPPSPAPYQKGRLSSIGLGRQQFFASEHWYRHGLVASILFTDGAKYVADQGGAYWLLDEIALAQRYEKAVAAETFQVCWAAIRARNARQSG